MNNNPYVLLQIKETANSSEIRKALKRQIDKYCGIDESNGNRKNSDGKYLREMFVEAARSLLDPKKRAEIDKELAKLRKENGIELYSEQASKKNNNAKSTSSEFTTRTTNGNVSVKRAVKTNVDEETIDVSKLHICVYNEDCIGLFKKRCVQFDGWWRKVIEIYESLDSNYTGIKVLCNEAKNSMNGKFLKCGESIDFISRYYSSDCSIKSAISFDDMRFKLLKSGLIKPYKMGKATSSEMLEVLSQAYDYYNLGSTTKGYRRS